MFGSNYTHRRDPCNIPNNHMAESEAETVKKNGRSSSSGVILNHDHLWTGPKLKENGTNGSSVKLKQLEMKPVATSPGVLSPHVLLVIVLWYIISFVVLVLNKHILSTMKGDPVVLSSIQMSILSGLAYLHILYPCGLYKPIHRDGKKPPRFFWNMLLVGSIRFATVFLGVLALKYVTVSFTETIKSSAPIFTVIISLVVLGEQNGLFVLSSLIPIVGGLALCSAYELSFNIQGFVAALGTNLAECMQFVFSKLLISGDFKYTPAEFQCYTGLASVAVQIPCCLLLVDIPVIRASMTTDLFMTMAINGAFYHVQTFLAFILMSYISPVTHSVVNVVKRAFMIWGSILVFGNPVTFLGSVGTIIVFVGVLLYNHARSYEQTRRSHIEAILSTDVRKC